MKQANPRHDTRNISRRTLLSAIGSAAALAHCPGFWVRAAEPADRPSVRSEPFGETPDTGPVDLYILRNPAGLEARIMTLGATLTTLSAPDRAGQPAIITLHLKTLEDYVRGHPLFGSVVGRYANRIANARFTIDNREYKLIANANPHHIHGGNKEAFHRVVWKAQPLAPTADAAGVRFTHTSRDGEAGFPGAVQATVTYSLTADNRLILDYTATTDQPTHVNLTNHAYWNLASAGSGDVLNQRLQINADHYLAADRLKIPTGQVLPVKNTVMDFTTPHAVGERIQQVEDQNYDHCYVLNKPAPGALALAARASDPRTGRWMEVHTTQPGVQLYTAKGLGKPYAPYHGFCLETQHYPDSPNRPNFPSTLLRPGQTFHQTTIHRFGVEA